MVMKQASILVDVIKNILWLLAAVLRNFWTVVLIIREVKDVISEQGEESHPQEHLMGKDDTVLEIGASLTTQRNEVNEKSEAKERKVHIGHR